MSHDDALAALDALGAVPELLEADVTAARAACAAFAALGAPEHVLARAALAAGCLLERFEAQGAALFAPKHFAAATTEARSAAAKKAWESRRRAVPGEPKEPAPVAAPENKAPEKKVRKAVGWHLPTDVRDRLAALPGGGPSRWPAVRIGGKEGRPFDPEHDLRWNADLRDPTAEVIAHTREVSARTGVERWQPIYSREHDRLAAEVKFAKIAAYEGKLPGIQRQLLLDLGGERFGTARHGSLAALALAAHTGLRIGSDEASVEQGHYGITQLRPDHVAFRGEQALLRFVGKEGVENRATVEEPALVAALRGYAEDARRVGRASIWPEGVTYDRVAKTRVAGAEDLSPKDFRTLLATRWGREGLARNSPPPPPLPRDPELARGLIKDVVTRASTYAAEWLNNQPTEAFETYIHPVVFRGWLEAIPGYDVAVHGAASVSASRKKAKKEAQEVAA